MNFTEKEKEKTKNYRLFIKNKKNVDGYLELQKGKTGAKLGNRYVGIFHHIIFIFLLFMYFSHLFLSGLPFNVYLPQQRNAHHGLGDFVVLQNDTWQSKKRITVYLGHLRKNHYIAVIGWWPRLAKICLHSLCVTYCLKNFMIEMHFSHQSIGIIIPSDFRDTTC